MTAAAPAQWNHHHSLLCQSAVSLFFGPLPQLIADNDSSEIDENNILRVDETVDTMSMVEILAGLVRIESNAVSEKVCRKTLEEELQVLYRDSN